jgi:hypothetical protein
MNQLNSELLAKELAARTAYEDAVKAYDAMYKSLGANPPPFQEWSKEQRAFHVKKFTAQLNWSAARDDLYEAQDKAIKAKLDRQEMECGNY